MPLCYENSVTNSFILDEYNHCVDWGSVAMLLLEKYDCFVKGKHDTKEMWSRTPFTQFGRGQMVGYIFPNNTHVIATYDRGMMTVDDVPQWEHSPRGIVYYDDDVLVPAKRGLGIGYMTVETFFKYMKTYNRPNKCHCCRK